MKSQIDQTEKTQGAFIVYKNVLFIRGKVKKLTEKHRKKCLVNLRLRSSRSPTAMTSCANNILNKVSCGAVMTAEGVLSSKSYQAEGDITGLSVVPVEWQSACHTRQRHVLLADTPVSA